MSTVIMLTNNIMGVQTKYITEINFSKDTSERIRRVA
jgi:hypothetical protein